MYSKGIFFFGGGGDGQEVICTLAGTLQARLDPFEHWGEGGEGLVSAMRFGGAGHEARRPSGLARWTLLSYSRY